MKRTDELQGRRLPDADFKGAICLPHMDPGDYMKVLVNPGGYTWYVTTPNGLLWNLANHTVREEDDGSISVKPGDGSSNSILVGTGDKSWHGYITRGLWWSLA